MSDGLASRAWRTVIGGASTVVSGATAWLATIRPGVTATATVSGTPAKPDVKPALALTPTDAVLKVDQKPALAVTQTATTGTLAKPAVNPALAVSQSASSGTVAKPAVTPAVVVTPTASTGTIAKPAVSPALAVSQVATVGTPAKPAVNPAPALGTVFRDFTVADTPALEIVQVIYDLTHRKGAATATSAGSGGWSTPSNATGDHNGTLSSHTGNAVAAQAPTLTLTYDDFVNKTDLTIVSVKLHFYVKQAGTVANNGDLVLYRGDATSAFAAQLERITGNVDSLTTPRTFDVTSSYTTWASLDALRAGVEHLTGVGEVLIIADVDAVELEVTATTTQVP